MAEYKLPFTAKEIEDKLSNSGFVDVEALPTENIKDGAIYRVGVYGEDFELFFADGSGEVQSINEEMKAEGFSFEISVVNELPIDMKISDQSAGIGYVYIIESTGVGYIDVGMGPMRLGLLLAGEPSHELTQQWTTDPYSETTAGLYWLRKQGTINSYLYYTFKDGIWTELSGSGIIDVESLPSNSTNENSIYRVCNEMCTGASIYLVDGSGNPAMNLAYIAEEENITLHVSVIDNAETASLKVSTQTDMYLFIDSASGIAYCDFAYGTWTVGYAFGLEYSLEVPDNGWSADITAETEPGFYCVMETAQYYTYHVCANGNWTELSSGGIIDVKQLPSGNVDENKIYRIKNSGGSADIWLHMGSQPVNFSKMLAAEGAKIETVVVTELPTNMKVSQVSLSDDATAIELYAYVLDSTGIAYADIGNGATTLGVGLIGAEGFDRGWSDDIMSETDLGIYCVRTSGNAGSSYHVYSNGVWSELSTGIAGVGLSPKDQAMLASIKGSYTYGLEYEDLSDTTCKVIGSGTCQDVDIIIPPVFNNKDVVEIGQNAFSGYYALADVHIPESVTTIDSGAFRNCYALKSIRIPEGVTSINYEAFSGCTELESVVLPRTVTYINGFAFRDCTNLASISMGINTNIHYNDKYTVEHGILYNKQNNYSIVLAPRKLDATTVTFWNGCTAIGTTMFKGNDSIQYLELPDSITSVGHQAFAQCTHLTAVTVNKTSRLTEIQHYAFSNCDSLKKFTIPTNTVTNIGESSLSSCCNIEDITLPFVGESRNATIDSRYHLFGHIFGGVKSYGLVAVPQHYGNTCDTYYLPEKLKNVTIVGGQIIGHAFENCTMIETLTLLGEVSNIETTAFEGCNNLREINVAEDNENYSSIDGVLYNKEKTEIIYIPPKHGYVHDFAGVNEKLANCATKEYVDDTVANGGLSVKKIEFTDRPTAWEWLKNNYQKALKAVLESSQTPIPIVYNNIKATYSGNEVGSVRMAEITPYSSNETTITLDILLFAVTDSNTAVNMGAKEVIIDTSSAITMSGAEPQILPDEYWAQLSAKLTVYYID